IHVTATSADLPGRLLGEGGASASAAAFWGPADGGVDAAAWAHTTPLERLDNGQLAASLPGLTPGEDYYYRFRAQNSYGHAWAPESGTFTTAAVTVRAADPRADEIGGDTGTFTISRPANATRRDLTVQFTIAGTAESGRDFQPIAGSVTIPAGSASVDVPVIPVDDLSIAEPEESVTLALAPGPYALGDSVQATVTIADHTDLAAWPHGLEIVFSGYDGEEALDGFPALVVLGPSCPGFDYDQFASATGGDLRFIDPEGSTFLNYEIEEWNPEGDSRVWVELPRLARRDTAILACWGNPAASEPPAYATNGDTWAARYAGVWHFTEADGPRADSSPAANHAEPEGEPRCDASGVIGAALALDGADDSLVLPGLLPIGNSDITVSAWVNVPTAGSGGLEPSERVGILLGNFRDTPCSNWEIRQGGELRMFWNGGEIDQAGATDLRDGAWHHVAWVRDKARGGFALYIDGREDRFIEGAGTDVSFSTTHRVGGDNRGQSAPRFHGGVDELRVSTVARSGDWLRASWKNQSAYAEFVSYGGVQPAESR
ncbi:MAG: DUF2341 domain-containing protein, partial [Candidatus Hydrogenedentes bacterium]|nr:DUF2341 domain-containing protein [Candidatus Hydrogenedentota bacterium]